MHYKRNQINFFVEKIKTGLKQLTVISERLAFCCFIALFELFDVFLACSVSGRGINRS